MSMGRGSQTVPRGWLGWDMEVHVQVDLSEFRSQIKEGEQAYRVDSVPNSAAC